MKSKLLILLLVIIALVAGLLMLRGNSSGEENLVPAWQVLARPRYAAQYAIDPFVSWSPDSRSILLSAVSFRPFQSHIYCWNIGEKRLLHVTRGISPNYMPDGKSFIYLKAVPKGIFQRDIETGAEKEICTDVKKSQFWSEITAVGYNVRRKALLMRMSGFTRYYMPGTEAYGLDGKAKGVITSNQGDDVLDYSGNGKLIAAIIGSPDVQPTSLRICKPGKEVGKEIASGKIGAVAWQPGKDVIAYADGNEVLLARQSDGKKMIIGRFCSTGNTSDGSYICRLKWSPNADYLAAEMFVPDPKGNCLVIYVMDTSELKW